MRPRRLEVAPDCAILPGPAGFVLYQGTTGRKYLLQPHIGQWLVDGAPWDSVLVSSGEQEELAGLGVIRPRLRASGCTLAAVAPAGRTGRYLLLLLIALGSGAWSVVILNDTPHLSAILPEVLRSWAVWATVPLSAVFGTIVHEWGHVLALRAVGGRPGRVRFRLGWPWAVTEVGPFETVLAPLQSILLVSGGVLVELAILGFCLAVLIHAPSNPVAGAAAVTTTVYLLFNVIPTPWSDGGKALGIVVGQIRALLGGR